MKLSMIVLLWYTNAHADFDPLQGIVFTKPTTSDASIKRFEKAGYVHTGKLLNQRIKNLKVSVDRSKGLLRIELDYPSLEWYRDSMKFPLLIRVADKNGNILSFFHTQPFVLAGVYDRTRPNTWGRSYLDGTMGSPKKKAVQIKPKGNFFDYDLDQKDAEHVAIVEVGFVTKIDSGMDATLSQVEYWPEAKFIKDWSK